MADPLKLDAIAELRDITARATKVFDDANIWMIRFGRMGFIPTQIDPEADDPFVNEDFVGSAEGLTTEQLYGVVQFFASLFPTVTPETAKLMARFGREMARQ